MPNDQPDEEAQPVFALEWPERRPRPPRGLSLDDPMAALEGGRTPMLKRRLRELFEGYDPSIQEVISRVLAKEQEFISLVRPRVKEDVDLIVTVVANEVLKQVEERKAEA